MLYVCVSQDDYRRGVNEYDEKVFVSFKLILRELRNIYVSISVTYHTVVKANWVFLDNRLPLLMMLQIFTHLQSSLHCVVT